MTPSVQIAGGRRRARWTRETIIERIAEWARLHGEPPVSADWNPSLARWRAQEWRIERYRDGDWPSTNAVKRHFGGSFDAAVRAAGLAPARPGPKRAAHAARPAVAERRAPQVEGDADARVRAALDQADAAVRDATAARAEALHWAERAREAEARLHAAEDTARLAGADGDRLRSRGPAGPAVLGEALRRLAAARGRGDRAGLARALSEVAAAAVGWRDRL